MDATQVNRGLLGTGELVRRLGIRRYQLYYLIETGQVPDAQCKKGNRRLFTEEEAAHIERLLRRDERDTKHGDESA